MMSLSFFLIISYGLCSIKIISSTIHNYDYNLPHKHMSYFFSNHPFEAEACRNSENCPYKAQLNIKKCWGYENNCSTEYRYSSPICKESSKRWTNSKTEQLDIFYNQADFGYIQERIKELMVLCTSKEEDGGFLECTRYLRFCRGKRIMFDFKTLVGLPEPMRYRDDIIREGQVGSFCKLNKNLLKQQGEHKSPLQSWYAEFEHFKELSEKPNNGMCDVVIQEPTFVMKLDATVNMYHHFCDFINLYASLHINQTFSTDIRILIWDTIPYLSNFGIVWKAFTKHPLMNLDQFRGKKVCLENAVFPLLPRMIYGMYYNMPLIPGCQGSGLFQAFSEHIKHRLSIPDKFVASKIRVTLISRGTQYRRILNENELLAALEKHPDVVAEKVNFNRQMPFLEQLIISYNTDILIGIHGAGLTHMLFMPPWGAVFEIYNCEDAECYADLARLKGLKYVTWEKADKVTPEDEGHHPTLGAHAKFTNYSFDVKEFLRIFKKALGHVKKHRQTLLGKNKTCDGTICGRDEL